MKILEKYSSDKLQLENRIAMAPMTRSRADNENHLANELMQTYYTQRASAGLIITEGINISTESVGYINVPGIYTDEQTESWKKITNAVHEKGGKIFAQLWHVGRISHPDFHNGNLPLAPSAVNPDSQSYTYNGFKDTVAPKAMTLEDIKRTTEDFVKAAENAIKAGFDGIEIHAANGYLFHQFFALTSNKREDEYGGSIENRGRILFEVLDAIGKKVSFDKIGLRLAPDLDGIFGMVKDEETQEMFEYLVNKVNDYNLAYLHFSGFTEKGDHPQKAIFEIAKHYRGIYKGTFMINGGFLKDTANKALEENLADLISIGVPYIANPDLVERFAVDAPLNQADPDTFYVPGAKGYTDYPALKS
ncbi:alkene reductase [Frigoriflavimonas asaccharolytica]|uniref:N-ethylmaleimide reductase n=1 Tax=Frigoriflavimonas asaccharolytica TaxID=2735899 RepID=A0A8J8G6C0_9FLAO|nr:alkene reductase [Frigoriflavimonas asaccharolytica]NRS92064.1 N-ethylmaleimide reductase [Frigoriflavimonas asaccharolytica]